MSILDNSTRPHLAPGCRWAGAENNSTLVYPEGALRLQPTAAAILERCDGQRTFEQIVRELQNLYSASEPDKIRADVASLLNRLHEKRVVDF
jgi:pyrroloquinoline quinone biosynthesis protein D